MVDAVVAAASLVVTTALVAVESAMAAAATGALNKIIEDWLYMYIFKLTMN